jgi:SpoVK/Ycf46/Vps4 family AAA+-type ATPase
MATAQQIQALVESYVSGDDGRFRTVAMQIAAHSAKHGKKQFADQLRKLLDEAAARREIHVGPAKAIPIARPTRDLAGLLAASYPETRLSDMVLKVELRSELKQVITEHRQRERLRSYGLQPRQRLLLVGPPGCGKTMTASALAGECHLPLMFVQLHSLITKFMGETAAKLHLIFEAMEKTPGVYLFDEFDAIGSVRRADSDLGEIRRVLNSFLQFLEHHTSESIVVAATNLLPILDPALFRRFDATFRYELPKDDEVAPLIKHRLSAFTLHRPAWKRIIEAARGLSHADVVRAAENAARLAVLGHQKSIRTDDLLTALTERRMMRPEEIKQ